MHFEQSLKRSIYPPWKDKYIDYPKLKRLLRDNSSEAGTPPEDEENWTAEDEGAFVEELINHQLEKVAAFQSDTVQGLRDRTTKCEAQLEPFIAASKSEQEAGADVSQTSKPPAAGQITLHGVLKELDNTTKELNELEKYSRINYTGFLKATKKHDRKRGDAYRVRPLMQVRLAELPFNKEDYSPLLFRLSTLYGFIRQHLQDPDNKVSFSESHTNAEDYTSYKCTMPDLRLCCLLKLIPLRSLGTPGKPP